MQRFPGGDGARFVTSNGMITAIELILTDNAFGDSDMAEGRITDPGVPLTLSATKIYTADQTPGQVDFYGSTIAGSLPLHTWYNSVTGDYFYGVNAAQVPYYSCYVQQDDLGRMAGVVMICYYSISEKMFIMKNYQDLSTMKKMNNLRKKALLVMAVAVSAISFLSSGVQAEESRKHDWYATGSAMRIIDTSGLGPRINLNPAVVDGISDYVGNMVWSLAVGHEGALCRGACAPQNVRLEVEGVAGSIDRKGIDVPGSRILLDDTVTFRALFLNGMLGLLDTKHTRWWLGGGIGYGQTKFPDARSATSCGCLQPLTHDDVAFRVKLQAEREISKNAALFAEAGYIKLTGGETHTIPGVDYGALNLTNLSLGIRLYL